MHKDISKPNLDEKNPLASSDHLELKKYDDLRKMAITNHISQLSIPKDSKSKSKILFYGKPRPCSDNFRFFCTSLKKALYILYNDCQTINQKSITKELLKSLVTMTSAALISQGIAKTLQIEPMGSTMAAFVFLKETKDLISLASLKESAANFLKLANSNRMPAIADAIIAELAYQFENLIDSLQAGPDGIDELVRWFSTKISIAALKNSRLFEKEDQLIGHLLLQAVIPENSLFNDILKHFNIGHLTFRDKSTKPLSDCLFYASGITEDGSIYSRDNVSKPFLYPLRKLPSHSYAVGQNFRLYHQPNYDFLIDNDLTLGDIGSLEKVKWSSEHASLIFPLLDCAPQLPLQVEAELHQLRNSETSSLNDNIEKIHKRAKILNKYCLENKLISPEMKQNKKGNRRFSWSLGTNHFIQIMSLTSRLNEEISILEKFDPKEYKKAGFAKETVMQELIVGASMIKSFPGYYWNNGFCLNNGVVSLIPSLEIFEDKSSGIKPNYTLSLNPTTTSPSLLEKIKEAIGINGAVKEIANYTSLSVPTIEGILSCGMTILVCGLVGGGYRLLFVGLAEAVEAVGMGVGGAFLVSAGGVLAASALNKGWSWWCANRESEQSAFASSQYQIAMDSSGEQGKKDLLSAASNGDSQSVCRLLKHGIFADITDEEGRTPLMKAVMRGHVETVGTLIEHKATVDYPNEEKETPLFFAVKKGGAASKPIIKRLLEGRANIESESSAGLTPLAMAKARAGKDDSILKLLEESQSEPGLTLK